MNSNENNNKFLVILGPTGIGKTFISLNISKKFNGIIINSDAFSLYKEADVMTAKATEEEKKISPHKLIDVLDLTERPTRQVLRLMPTVVIFLQAYVP